MTLARLEKCVLLLSLGWRCRRVTLALAQPLASYVPFFSTHTHTNTHIRVRLYLQIFTFHSRPCARNFQMKYLTFSLKSQQKVTQTDCDVSARRRASTTPPRPLHPLHSCIPQPTPSNPPPPCEMCIKLKVCPALNVTFASASAVYYEREPTELTPGKRLQRVATPDRVDPAVPCFLLLSPVTPCPPVSCFRCAVIFKILWGSAHTICTFNERPPPPPPPATSAAAVAASALQRSVLAF